MTQEQLAEMVGISVTHMSHIETGNTKMSLPVAADIAKALSVHVDALLYDKPSMGKTEIADEILKILESCSRRELCLILDVIRNLKKTLRKYWY